MRWFWIDRFTEFQRGRSATAVKAVALSEDHLHDHFPGAAIMPNSLVLEGMAQTAGILVCDHIEFSKQVVLAKVAKAIFHCEAWPGETLTYRAEARDVTDEGAMVTVTSHIGERPQAEAELFFAHISQEDGRAELFHPYDLFSWLRLLKLYEVGRDDQGNPLPIHPRMSQSDPYFTGEASTAFTS